MDGKLFIASGFILIILWFGWVFSVSKGNADTGTNSYWEFQSIDTMKYSRDLAKEKLLDANFDDEIDAQIKSIASTGATHVSIATPYDEEFLSFLRRWVRSARKYNLKVWFRGNWSGWEGWFGYEKNMSFDSHINKSVAFIKAHPDIFENGDYFTPCPECENGAAGDPRQTGKVNEYRAFLIDETAKTKDAFDSVGKNVATNLLSMNKDVASLIMDKETAQAVGGVITIDHYVPNPDQLNKDIDQLSQKTGAKIILGEFGAPIPDLTGALDEDAQARWLDQAFQGLIRSDKLIGLSYWTNKDGSTLLWNKDNSPRKSVSVVTKYFKPRQIFGFVKNDLGMSLDNVEIKTQVHTFYSNSGGTYQVSVFEDSGVVFSKNGYEDYTLNISEKPSNLIEQNIVLKRINPPLWYIILKFFKGKG